MIEGLFIVLEGVDGAGTTTQTKLLTKSFERRGLPVHATREPSDGPIGVLLRQMLSGRVVVPGLHGPRAPSWATMTLLFAADRLDHIEAEIVPYVEDGITVISDRYDHSSIAYQSLSSDAPETTLSWVREVNRRARRPDLVIVLDIPAGVAEARRADRSGRRELYETPELQSALVTFYANIEKHFPGDRIVHIDSNRPVADVAADIARAVSELRGET